MEASLISVSSFRAFLGVLLFIWSCSAWTYVPVTDNNLISSADSIVLGNIVANVDSSHSEIDGAWSHYQVELVHVLKHCAALKRRITTKKSDSEPTSLMVSVVGGYDAERDQTLHVTGAPEYQIGDKVLLFLSHDETSGQPINQITHFALGSFQKIEVPSNLRDGENDMVLVRNFDLELLDGKSEDTNLEVRKYGEFIRHIVRTISTSEEEQLEASSRVSDYFTTVSSKNLASTSQARFNTFKYQQRTIRWSKFDTKGSVKWNRHISGQAGLDGGGAQEIRQALNAWTNQPNTPISYVDDVETNAETAFISADGVNSIIFEDPKNVIPKKYDCAVGGTLALGGWWTSGKEYEFRGITFAEVVEADIVGQDGISCWFAKTNNPSSSFANLMTHELGHTLGLDHSCGDADKCIAGSASDNAVMRPTVHNSGGALLTADDNIGIEYIYSTCYPNCVAAQVNGTYQDEAPHSEAIIENDSESKILGVSKKNSMIIGGAIAFVVVMAAVAIIATVIVKKRKEMLRERVRSRSSSLIIDPYDHIDIAGFVSPQTYISPTRLSYYDHFQQVSNNLNALQQQQQNGVTSPSKPPKSPSSEDNNLDLQVENKKISL